jgi:hypothetical protein
MKSSTEHSSPPMLPVSMVNVSPKKRPVSDVSDFGCRPVRKRGRPSKTRDFWTSDSRRRKLLRLYLFSDMNMKEIHHILGNLLGENIK